MTVTPPTRYRPTLSGDSFSAARPIDLMPRMMTAHTSTAMTRPASQVGTPNTLSNTMAIEFGWVKGVVVSAPMPAMSANALASPGEP